MRPSFSMGGRAATLIAALLLATAGGANAAGNPVGVLNADFSPKALSKTKPTPIRFSVSAHFRALAEHPPPLRELFLRFDSHVSLGLKGVPTVEDIPACLPALAPRPGVEEIRRDCALAMVGYGRMDVEVQFPDEAPVPLESQLLVLNGGVKGGKVRLYLYSYFSAPVTSAVVATMEIKRIRAGRYGLEAIAMFPKIAGGNGSITSFALSLKRSVLSATCPNGHLAFDSKSFFGGSTHLSQPIVRTCTGKDESRR